MGLICEFHPAIVEKIPNITSSFERMALGGDRHPRRCMDGSPKWEEHCWEMRLWEARQGILVYQHHLIPMLYDRACKRCERRMLYASIRRQGRDRSKAAVPYLAFSGYARGHRTPRCEGELLKVLEVQAELLHGHLLGSRPACRGSPQVLRDDIHPVRIPQEERVAARVNDRDTTTMPQHLYQYCWNFKL
jgi:hypothetical protein